MFYIVFGQNALKCALNRSGSAPPDFPLLSCLGWPRGLTVCSHSSRLLIPAASHLFAALFACLVRPSPLLLSTLELLNSPLFHPNCRWVIENSVAALVWLSTFYTAGRGGARQVHASRLKQCLRTLYAPNQRLTSFLNWTHTHLHICTLNMQMWRRKKKLKS